MVKKAWTEYCLQGGHKPGKHEKLREFEKLSKSQGKLREIRIFIKIIWRTQGKCGKCRTCGRIGDENVFQRIILSRITQGKI